jgi:glutamine synthetase
MAMLNAAVADALGQMAKRLKTRLDAGQPRDAAVLELLREVFTETAAIRFEGNGYSEEWTIEAARRGLPNIPDTPGALEAMARPEQHRFLSDLGILSDLELNSHFNVAVERYVKQVTLEAETLIEMLSTLVVPAAEKQLALTAAAWNGLAAARTEGRVPSTLGARAAAASGAFEGRIGAISAALETVCASSERLTGLLSDLDCVHDEQARARRLADELRPLMAEAREAADRLEKLVDDELWPLPKYREMLFVK